MYTGGADLQITSVALFLTCQTWRTAPVFQFEDHFPCLAQVVHTV